MDELMRTLSSGAGPSGGSKKDDDPLGNLLGMFTTQGGEGQPPSGGDLLGGLLGTLLGGGAQTPVGGAGDVTSLAEQTQVTPAIVQAVVALLIGQMGKSGTAQSGGADLGALLDQASRGEDVDEAALKSSGLPQELMKTTGLDLAAALRALQKLLPALAGLFNLPALKPVAKPNPKPAAKPKPTAKPSAKPKPTSASSSRPKPKPASSAKPKPSTATSAKPKPASSGKPKPAGSAKPRPRKSDGVVEINLGEPADVDG